MLILVMLVVGTHLTEAQTSPHGDIKIACEKCHTTDSWHMRTDAEFTHASTGFELTGMHRTIECNSCHEKFVFTGAQKACQTCHTDVHKGNLGLECIRCHSTLTWRITDMMQRHQQTRFPLLGRHAQAECQACHTQYANQQYAGTPTICLGCHNVDFQNAQNPNHLFAGFSTDCVQCHQVTDASWGGSFNHQLTVFPLTGAHQAVPCSQCHLNNNFKSISQDCYTCHQTNYQAVQSPNHAAGGFSHLCQTCHTTTVWKPSTFSHDNTAFPLVGAHRAVLCEQCHINNQYVGLHSNCVDCHLRDFNTAANPNHVAGTFTTNCTFCHGMNSWQPATFNHSTTKFPLTGTHTTLQCQLCHTNGNYQITYNGCYACHIAEYNGTTNPNHGAGGFVKTCETCHSTSSWANATFDHSSTKFPLTGAHTTLQCQLCHTNGNYQLAYGGCYACHSSDYAGTTNPNHTTSGYPTTCETCHSTTAWTGATFNHTWFPTNHGNANGVCSTCHTNPANYAVFQCTVCHTKTQTDSNHNGVTGYVWNSINCYQCHPRGSSN